MRGAEDFAMMQRRVPPYAGRTSPKGTWNWDFWGCRKGHGPLGLVKYLL